jgi:hypothetical protein
MGGFGEVERDAFMHQNFSCCGSSQGLFCRLEVEVQTVAKAAASIKGSHLEAALYLQDPAEPSGVRLVKEGRVGTAADNHWVSVDTSAKPNFKEAWYGGQMKVGPQELTSSNSTPSPPDLLE